MGVLLLAVSHGDRCGVALLPWRLGPQMTKGRSCQITKVNWVGSKSVNKTFQLLTWRFPPGCPMETYK